ncbi:hypothetical protein ACFQXB_16035 [Plastorhodobacter daqingensis]|uniref:PH domain-containing protein n=1 Tax=Plastorhodobacter daqingensis TaxID=1387281 RepID=A0ABW2ULU0_9RHOB
MSAPARDPHLTDPRLLDDETVLVRWRSSRATYWRDHAAMGAIGIVGAMVVLFLLGKPDQAPVGAIGVMLGIGVRAVYLASEQLSAEWLLTDRRLLGPQGRIVPLRDLAAVRPVLSDVQLVTTGGDKHLMKHMADRNAVIARIEAQRSKRKKAKR